MKLNTNIKQLLREGAFIPACPLALTENLQLDVRRQNGLVDYYLDAGVGGLAVGVHTTQFEIREPQYGLLEPVLATVAEQLSDKGIDKNGFIKVAGICGPTDQAVREAELAVKYGYHLGLVSNGGLNDWSNEALLERVQAIAEVIPVFGFYLQPAVGGRVLDYDFWKGFADLKNVEAIKVAAFNRYQTLDVVRAVCHSSRADQIDLYTGNDDNIIADLLTPYRIPVGGEAKEKRFVGGLLGHWSVWTAPAVAYFKAIKAHLQNDEGSLSDLLALGVQVTDLNQAIFDPRHQFSGSIAGIHEVLRRLGLLAGLWCLNPKERLSEGQLSEIDRVTEQYPQLTS